MRNRLVSLILLANLLVSSSGVVLALHLACAGAHHDGDHCELCLALMAPSPAVVDDPVPTLFEGMERWPASAEPVSVVLTRIAHPSFGSRAPPV